MTHIDKKLLSNLKDRGLVAQMTGEAHLEAWLQESRVLYCGFDPTADSLHIGHLVPLLTLKRFQLAGHKPIALVGGATGLIGDPSFKAQERKLNTENLVATWVESLRAQVSRFLDFGGVTTAAEVLNNLDWVGGMDVLSFLRDIGKYFSVNNMIQKESVKQRIEREGTGISFTEFTYMVLQSFDFAQLYKSHNCSLQIGGSDQWGNIVGGIDLAKRMHGGQVFGLTLPLVTKADGTKFGKTESGTVWLDANKTSPYAFYQFWLNTADADVYKFLRYFTFISVESISKIEAEDAERQGRPEAQAVLATEITRMVHGVEGLKAAQRISEVLFSGAIESLSHEDFKQLRLDGLPSTEVAREALTQNSLSQWLVDAELVSSGKQVKDALKRKALTINGHIVEGDTALDAGRAFAKEVALYQSYYLIKLGKKKYHLFEVK